MKTLYTHDEALELIKNNPNNFRLWINPIESGFDELQVFNKYVWRTSQYVKKA